MVKLIEEKNEKKEIAELVLLDLPDWFGIPENTKNYINESSVLPFFAYFFNNQPIGFITLKETSPYTAEIHCMGILKKYHRCSFGRELFRAFEKYTREQGYLFIQVKTVKQGCYDEYDKTNIFYKSMGFYELEVFPTLWDKRNPCQIFIKSIL
jgi:GNAT superfamily N-acetyltransferase